MKELFEDKLRRWVQIASDLKMLESSEAEAHPHCPEERAEWLRCAPYGPTEFEVLNFLFASVLLYKPQHILDTGTQAGFSAIALAAAVDFNGFGRVTTLDCGDCAQARATAEKYDLDRHIIFVQTESVEFTRNYEGEPFDFAFFDTSIHTRHIEVRTLWERRKLGKLAAFHDTSRLRYVSMNEGTGDDFSPEYIASLDDFAARACLNGLESHYGRGFRMMEIKA